MLPGRRTSATARGARPGDRVVAAEDDRDGARRRDLANLAVDHRVAALDPRRDDVRVARHRRRVRTSNGSTSSWSEWIEPAVYCAWRMARGPNRAPDRCVTASSNGAPMIATSTPRPRSSAGIRDPGQLRERDRADVGRQVEVVVVLELAIPAPLPARTCRRRVDAVGRRAGLALGHDRSSGAGPRLRAGRRSFDAAGSDPPSSGARQAAS